MSGWYPDPTGRFEYRFHNDQVWTSDVASAGQRFVDPLPSTVRTTAAADGSANTGNGLAVAGMVCGIVAVATAWIPFVVVVAIVVAIVGLGLSIPGLVRSRPTGRRRGFAIAGIVTSACALGLSIVGIVLTAVLAEAIERYDDPGPHDARLVDCTVSDRGEVVARGVVANGSTDERTYSVVVRLGSDHRDSVLVEDVPAGTDAEFEARAGGSGADADEDPDCSIESVNGPPPFGLDPDVLD